MSAFNVNNWYPHFTPDCGNSLVYVYSPSNSSATYLTQEFFALHIPRPKHLDTTLFSKLLLLSEIPCLMKLDTFSLLLYLELLWRPICLKPTAASKFSTTPPPPPQRNKRKKACTSCSNTHHCPALKEKSLLLTWSDNSLTLSDTFFISNTVAGEMTCSNKPKCWVKPQYRDHVKYQ